MLIGESKDTTGPSHVTIASPGTRPGQPATPRRSGFDDPTSILNHSNLRRASRS